MGVNNWFRALGDFKTEPDLEEAVRSEYRQFPKTQKAYLEARRAVGAAAAASILYGSLRFSVGRPFALLSAAPLVGAAAVAVLAVAVAVTLREPPRLSIDGGRPGQALDGAEKTTDDGSRRVDGVDATERLGGRADDTELDPSVVVPKRSALPLGRVQDYQGKIDNWQAIGVTPPPEIGDCYDPGGQAFLCSKSCPQGQECLRYPWLRPNELSVAHWCVANAIRGPSIVPSTGERVCVSELACELRVTTLPRLTTFRSDDHMPGPYVAMPSTRNPDGTLRNAAWRIIPPYGSSGAWRTVWTIRLPFVDHTCIADNSLTEFRASIDLAGGVTYQLEDLGPLLVQTVQDAYQASVPPQP